MGELHAKLLISSHSRTTSRRTQPHASTPRPTGVEGAGGSCRGAGGRWQGLAGLRDDAPSRRLAARTASGRAAAHRHTQRPGPTAPGTPVGPQATPSMRRAAAHRHTQRPEHHRRPEHPWGHNKTRPRPVSRPRPRHAHAAPFTTAPAIRRSCPRGPRPRRGQPRGGRRGRGTESRTRSPGPRCGRSGSTAGRHRARHTRRA